MNDMSNINPDLSCRNDVSLFENEEELANIKIN